MMIGLLISCIVMITHVSGNATLSDDKAERNVCELDPIVCPEGSTTCILKEPDDYYCQCLDGYKLKEGNHPEHNKEECIKEECNFGFPMCPEDSTTCVPKGSKDFYCRCLPGYKLKEGVVEEENKDSCLKLSKCDTDATVCPTNSSKCVVTNLEEGYYCECLPGFIRNERPDDSDDDICIRKETTETDSIMTDATPGEVTTSQTEASSQLDCDCGPNSARCYFNFEGDKVCQCLPGFSQMDGFCAECLCGSKSTGCSFDKYGSKTCHCRPGYAQKGPKCSEPCRNDRDCFHGYCRKYPDFNEFFCVCENGFTGDLCEKNVLCERLNKTCSYKNAKCQYVRRLGGETCECRLNYGNQWKINTCDENCRYGSCVHGICQDFGNYLQCKCDEGFTGPNCTISTKIITSINIGYPIIMLVIVIVFLAFISATIYLCVDYSRLKKKKNQNGPLLGSVMAENKQLSSA